MPVFDFSAAPADKKETKSQCTYTTFRSNETKATPEKPMLVLDNSKKSGNIIPVVFFQSRKQTAFEFKEEDGVFRADILKIDARFVKPDQMARRKSYQCPSFRTEYRRRICCLQDP